MLFQFVKATTKRSVPTENQASWVLTKYCHTWSFFMSEIVDEELGDERITFRRQATILLV